MPRQYHVSRFSGKLREFGDFGPVALLLLLPNTHCQIIMLNPAVLSAILTTLTDDSNAAFLALVSSFDEDKRQSRRANNFCDRKVCDWGTSYICMCDKMFKITRHRITFLLSKTDGSSTRAGGSK